MRGSSPRRRSRGMCRLSRRSPSRRCPRLEDSRSRRGTSRRTVRQKIARAAGRWFVEPRTKPRTLRCVGRGSRRDCSKPKKGKHGLQEQMIGWHTKSSEDQMLTRLQMRDNKEEERGLDGHDDYFEVEDSKNETADNGAGAAAVLRYQRAASCFCCCVRCCAVWSSACTMHDDDRCIINDRYF